MEYYTIFRFILFVYFSNKIQNKLKILGTIIVLKHVLLHFKKNAYVYLFNDVTR